jgi:hypothetical protein
MKTNAEHDDLTLRTIEVTASGSRRSLEELYLELRELAKQQDLEIEYRLSREKPE